MRLQSLIALCACLLGCCASSAQPSTFQYSLNSGVFTKYLGTIGGVFYDSPIIVNDITAAHGDFYLGMWNSTALGHGKYGETFGNEYDFYAGWSHKVGRVRYDVTGMYFLIARLSALNDDLWVIDQKVSFPDCPVVQPYVKLRFFNTVGRNSPSGGVFVWGGLSRQQPIGIFSRGRKMNVAIDLSAAYSDGPLGKTPGPVFGRLAIAPLLFVSERVSVSPSVVVQMPLGGQKNFSHPLTTRTEIVWGLNASTRF